MSKPYYHIDMLGINLLFDCTSSLTAAILNRAAYSILVYWITSRNFQITFLPNANRVISNTIAKLTWLVRISRYLVGKVVGYITHQLLL